MVDQSMKTGPEDWRPPRVVLVGMGMGREDLSERVLRWIDRAEVLAGGKRLLEYFPEHPAQRLLIQSPLNDSLKALKELSMNRRTAVLASGDPFFFGIGKRLAELLGKEQLIVFPNITTVQALFARLAEPWDDVRVLSLHGREEGDWLKEVIRHCKVAIFTDHVHTPSRIARQLSDAGITDRDLVVAEDLGFPGETVHRLSLAEVAERQFSPLNLVAVLPRDVSPESPQGNALTPYALRLAPHAPLFGLPEEAFRHQAGLITKTEIRAVVLCYLQLRPDLILWDLGAGSGSVSIEASRMAALKQVVAVEKHPERYRDLLENIRRLGCGEIRAIHANSGDVLDELPDPDRVFIGGSGGELQEILYRITQRLKPGGRVVQTIVTMDILEAARSFWQNQPFEVSLTQIQASRSVAIGNSVRLEAMNPVFILVAQRRYENPIPQ